MEKAAAEIRGGFAVVLDSGEVGRAARCSRAAMAAALRVPDGIRNASAVH